MDLQASVSINAIGQIDYNTFENTGAPMVYTNDFYDLYFYYNKFININFTDATEYPLVYATGAGPDVSYHYLLGVECENVTLRHTIF